MGYLDFKISIINLTRLDSVELQFESYRRSAKQKYMSHRLGLDRGKLAFVNINKDFMSSKKQMDTKETCSIAVKCGTIMNFSFLDLQSCNDSGSGKRNNYIFMYNIYRQELVHLLSTAFPKTTKFTEQTFANWNLIKIRTPPSTWKQLNISKSWYVR